MTSNRLAVAQTNLESTGKKNEEVLDDKKVATIAGFLYFEIGSNMARDRLRVVSFLLENLWDRKQRNQYKPAVVSVRAQHPETRAASNVARLPTPALYSRLAYRAWTPTYFPFLAWF